MKRIQSIVFLLGFALLLFACHPFVFAQDDPEAASLHKAKITYITITGNTYISQEIILANFPVKAGAVIEYKPLTETAKAGDPIPITPSFYSQLLENPFFGYFDLSIDMAGKKSPFTLAPYLDGYKLEVALKEYPKITSIQFNCPNCDEKKTRISQAELQKVISYKPGTVFNRALLKENSRRIQKLYRSKGLLAGLEPFLDEEPVYTYKLTSDGALTLNVDEIQIEEVRFSGNEIVDTKEIQLNVIQKTGELFDYLKLQDDIKRLQKMDYFKDVTYEIKAGSASYKAILTLVFTEKWGALVESVDVHGNETISSSMILSCITVKPGDPLKKDIIKQDLKTLESLGYFSFVAPLFLEGKTGTKLTYEVKENPHITSVSIEGNTVLPTDRILSVLKTSAALPMNFNLLAEDIKRVRMLYQKHGYILAEVGENTLDILEGKTGELHLKLYEGWIEDIRIEGEKEEDVTAPGGGSEVQLKPAKLRTKEYVIRREMSLKSGQIFNANILQKDLQKLNNLSLTVRLFEDVYYRLEPGTKPDSIILVIVLRESAQTGTALFGAGYSSQTSWSGTASITKENLFGKARRMKLDLTFGGISSYSFNYFEPWVDKKHTSLDLSLFREIIRRRHRVIDSTGTENLALYDQRRSGFGFTIGRPLQEYVRIYLGMQTEEIKIDATDQNTPLPSNIKSLEGDKRSLTLGIVKDTRDDIFDATKGVRDSFDLEISGTFLGGSIDFRKYSLEMRRYARLGHTKFIFASRLQLGLYTGDDIFPQQFFVGGTDTIRGYPDYFYVGSRMLVFNNELRYKISEGITAVLFTDIGNAWPLGQPLISNDIKLGSGLGIRFKTPIGPIRLDYGYGYNRKESQLHFSIGNMF